MSSLLLLNGPNLNMLGQRQPEIYGAATLPDVEAMCKAHAVKNGWTVKAFQSNSEGALVDAIQAARGEDAGIVLNAGAYTHTSVALRDAITSAEVPTVEVHLSNVHARESFRHHSYLTPVCLGVVAGFGTTSYLLAIDALIAHLEAAE